MEVPRGFISHLWNLLAFLPFFCLLLVLGIIKGTSLRSLSFLLYFVYHFLDGVVWSFCSGCNWPYCFSHNHVWEFGCYFWVMAVSCYLDLLLHSKVRILVIAISSLFFRFFFSNAKWQLLILVRTKKFGVLLKGLLFLCLPIPLILWLILGIIGSFFTGFGYGLFSPLMATFEAIVEGIPNKFVRCFLVWILYLYTYMLV